MNFTFDLPFGLNNTSRDSTPKFKMPIRYPSNETLALDENVS